MRNVIETVQGLSYFGLVLTMATFAFGRWVVKKTGIKAINPMVVSMVLVTIVLLVFDIDYEVYNSNARFFNFLLGPTTVALAIPLYRQVQTLKKHGVLIVISVACGAVSAMLGIFGLAWIMKLDPEIYRSILSKSITLAIALGITGEFGAYAELTIFAITVTGITGATLGLLACKFFRIREPVAVGLAMGTASHAIGTSCALERGEIEGSMAGLALVVAGLITVVAAPFIGYLL